ncbi:MAG: DUF1549 and DUF1553 domain-containing protein [Bryobacterales bacterium]|nr:DUF1549 and DUF1553 domain-containing protein [Bryobacterales bacterium]
MIPTIRARTVLAIGIVVGVAGSRAETGDEYFEKRVRPVLHEHCSQCHGEQIQSADIDFRDPGSVIGNAVIIGDESSPLIRAVRYESTVKMPPTSKLPEDTIATLVDWVRMGAPWPGYEPVAEAGADEAGEVVESSHWAFQPLADAEVPQVGDSAWVRNDIDRFVLAKLQENGLEPPAEAGKLTLLRRAKFDLQGLPPTEQEIRRFVGDSAPDAFARLAGDLLASPHYGERWGRHWLDVARYADSTGVDEDRPFGSSWRYRDYVVGAFNDDLPFDQFVREQIAGDLLAAPDGAPINELGIVATGFLALGPMALAQRDPIQKKYDVIDEQIDTTAKAFLGLTVACARCHDHKFDPILTSDYYALAGIFASTRTFDDWRKNGSRYYRHPLVDHETYERYRMSVDAVERLERILRVDRQVALHRYVANGPATQLAAYFLASNESAEAEGMDPEWLGWFREYLEPRPSPPAHLARWREAPQGREEAGNAYQEELLEVLSDRIGRLERWVEEAKSASGSEPLEDLPEFPRDLPSSALYSDLFNEGGPFDLDPSEIGDRFEEQDRIRLDSLSSEIEGGRAAMPEEPPMANSVAEGESVRQRIFRRGQHKNPGRSVAKRFPLVLAGRDQPEIASGSGRLELADWLASDSNPLTARVMVNRVWLWHFGEGLVRTPNNFGIRGQQPTHPKLLDWLARRFIESGWSIKALHGLIMDSATYRASSTISEAAYEKDPENRLWSRYERRRLTIEELRDSYLQISGRMDPAVGGDTDLGSGRLAEFVRNNRRIDPDEYTRRSIYLPLMRNKIPNLMGLFDFGDATTSSGQRSITNVAPQALYLINSRFAQGAAEEVAGSLAGPASERVRQTYRRILARPPSDLESDLAVGYVQAYSDAGDGWTSLCKMLLASNEFHFVE